MSAIPPSPSPPGYPLAGGGTLELIATSSFGLEAVVARELEQLGYDPKILQSGRILFRGQPRDLCRANLWLRTADRVLLRLDSFQATDFGVLFDRTRALPWAQWIPPDGEFPVSGRSIKSQLSSVPACQKIVKKAIVESLRAAHGVDLLAETGPKYSVEVALLEDQATLTIDTSGAGLHKRGYRRLVGQAPLKETMAAALVLLSFWKPERPLIDPFCGTGTIPIEAAMIGRNMAPGLQRAFAAEAWPVLPAALWEEAREEARQALRPDVELQISGGDVDDAALELARHHAQQAGLAEAIHFQRRSFAELLSKRPYGCVICNPPYGQRLGRPGEVEALYRAMPEVFRRLKTWSFYVLTAHPDFEAVVGQEADRRRKLYNGRIECTYYQFFGPKPRGLSQFSPHGREASGGENGTVPLAPRRAPAAAAPAFGGLSAKAREQAEIFRARLANRARHLRRWPTRLGITCYRLYDRDVPEVPLAVDRYDDYLHIAEYERPHEHTPAEHGDWLDLMKCVAGEVLEIPVANIFLKRRERQHGPAQYQRIAEQGRTAVVGEGGLRFEINLSDYIDTGLFLDHRITRGMVRDAAAGKRFLNLFAYTGSFTVYAAAGGAAETVSVDLTAPHLDWAERNLALNHLAGLQHQFVRDDALSFLRSCPPRALFDLAVVDPPTFSNSKRLEEFWDIQRDHAELLQLLLERMSPGGVIYFSTNSRRFKLAEETIGGVTIREISRQTVPADFRNRRIHRCWRMARSG
ncbi:MAG: bifunctional 23S rRNA (guanine(2069)-N(7))-methyltransferase RlmK/23S rRNA (guanine(2445)-N(2))-methyltransferase RlmL [Thermoguttaceae bacterium]